MGKDYNRIDVAYYAIIDYHRINDKDGEFIKKAYNDIQQAVGSEDLSVSQHLIPGKMLISAVFPASMPSKKMLNTMWGRKACQQALFFGETATRGFEGRHTDRFKTYKFYDFCPLMISTGIPEVDFIFRAILIDWFKDMSWENYNGLSQEDMEILTNVIDIADKLCKILNSDTDPDDKELDILPLKEDILKLLNGLTNIKVWLDTRNWKVRLIKENIFLETKSNVVFPVQKKANVSQQLEMLRKEYEEKMKSINNQAAALNGFTVIGLPTAIATMHQMQPVSRFPAIVASFAILATFLALISTLLGFMESSKARLGVSDQLADKFANDLNESATDIQKVKLHEEDYKNARIAKYLEKATLVRGHWIYISAHLYGAALLGFMLAAIIYFLFWLGFLTYP